MRGDCWLCGGNEVPLGMPVEKGVNLSTFSDTNAARAPESKCVCAACVWSLAGRPPDTLRLRSHYWDAHEHRLLNRADIVEVLIEPPAMPYVLTVALSGQKHIAFRARLTTCTEMPRVQLEGESILFSRKDFVETLAVYEALLAVGCSRTAIDTGSYRYADLKKARVEIEEHDEKIAPVRGEPLLRLISYCARRPENKEEA